MNLLLLAALLQLRAAPAPPPGRVWVCVSPTAYAYHRSPRCSGLGRCTHEVKQVPVAEAKKAGKYPCYQCW